MNNNNKRITAFLVAFFVGMGTVWAAYDFSATGSTGQTLYYQITDTDSHYVTLTCPGDYNWTGFTQPFGDIVLPQFVDHDGITYTLTSIGDDALVDCTEVTSVVIPNSVTYIGWEAFKGCTNLTTVNIPNSVVAIRDHVFHNTGWYNNQPDGILYLDNCCLGYKGNQPTIVSISDGTRIICDQAFSHCTALTSVLLPNTLTYIGDNAFFECYRWTCDLVIPNSVTYIGSGAFDGVDFNSLIIGSSVNYLGNHAFIPHSGVHIGNIIVLAETPPYCETYNYYTDFFPNNWYITVPCGTLEAYQAAPIWCNCTNLHESSAEITATANPSNGGTVSGAGNYCLDETCTLTATAATGYSFANWSKSGAIVSSNASYSFTVSESGEYTANFVPVNYSITTTASPYNGGTVSGAGSYNYGATCTLTATPASGYAFVQWNENGSTVSTSATYSFEVTGPRNLTAVFEQNTHWTPISGTLYNMTVSGYISINGVEQTSTTLEVGAFCGDECRGSFCAAYFPPTQQYIVSHTIVSNLESGETITFRLFDLAAGQELNLHCVNTIQFEADATIGNPSDWFDFAFSQEVTIAATAAVGGTVTGAGNYAIGASCTLTATPNPGYTFQNWTENGTVVSTDAAYSFTVNEPRTLVANFSLNSYEVLTGVDPEEGGTVTGGGTYAYGQTATLTATPNPGYEFDHWSEGYELQYFTIESLEDGNTITLTIPSTVPSTRVQSVSYSTDGGTTWHTTAIDETDQTINVTLGTGQRVIWKGTGKGYATANEASSYSIFSSTGSYEVKGNIASLLYGDDFIGKTTFPSNDVRAFQGLFFGSNKLVSAEKLVLPFMTLKGQCYKSMFQGCTSLAQAPELPATSLATNCYYSMFQNCRALTTAPELKATTLAPECYTAMFAQCIMLTQGPELPAHTLSGGCYRQMFMSCTSLNEVTCFATDVSASNCTQNWLLNVASTGTFHKAEGMTDWPTGASGVPNGWTVENYIGDYAAEYFTIESLEDGNTITLTIGAPVTQAQMQSISYSIDDGATWNTTTVDDTEQVISVSINANEKVLWKGTGVCMASSWQTSSWCTFNGTKQHVVYGNIASLLFGDDFEGQTVMPIGTNSGGRNYQRLFSGDTKLVSAQHLILPFTALRQICYWHMFSGCTSLTTAPEVLPATTLTYICYGNMFMGCSSLTTVPELPATSLAQECYSQMFRGCTSLTAAPELPATTLANKCYQSMFLACTSLNEVTCLATDISATDCTLNWLQDVASPGTFHKASGMNDWPTGASGIPNGWTVFEAAPVDPTEPSFSYTVTEDRYWLAHFILNSYEITASASPVEGGTVTGEGTYNHFESCTLTATANEGYTFVNWTENDTEVSTDATYIFTVTGPRTLVANFNPIIATQTFELVQGWNWWAPTVATSIETVEQALGDALVDIQSNQGSASGEAIAGDMYRIQTNAACTLSLSGMPMGTATVALQAGPNWFGYTGDEEKAIAEAVSVEAATGDKIVSQNGGFAIYNGTAWQGTLTTLQPGFGYVYVATENKTLTIE